MSSDSLKVLGVYSVTTKQNHLKTKWARECAGAIWPLSHCGHGEKRPLRIKGMEGGQGEAHHFTLQVTHYPPTQTHFYRLLSTPHTLTFVSAPFKGEHAIWNRAVCVTISSRTRYSLPFRSLIFPLFRQFQLLFFHFRCTQRNFLLITWMSM